MYLFHDSTLNTWKLITEKLPEKRFDARKFQEGIDKYNAAIAALKQNALTVGNPELRFEVLGGLEIRWREDITFLTWPGKYYKAHKEEGWVAILTLPKEKKNTMENNEEWRASPKPKKPLNEVLDSISNKIKKAKEQDEKLLVWKLEYDGGYLVDENFGNIVTTIENELGESMTEGDKATLSRVSISRKKYESLPDFDGF